MSDPQVEIAREPVDPAFVPLALWTAASFGLLVLSIIGAKLWATQPVDNATISVEILAIGQALLAAIAWPIWTRSVASAIGALLSAPAWLLLAGRIAASPVSVTAPFIWKLNAILALLALVRLATPGTAIGFVWAMLLSIALGGPVLWMLAKGG